MKVPFILTGRSATVFVDGTAHVITDSHANYKQIREVLRSDDHEGISTLIDVPKAIVKYSEGTIQVLDGEVLYNNEPLHNYCCTKLLEMMSDGFDISHLVRFMDRLMRNPSHRAVEELYMFLEATNLPITSDGHFLAFKAVSHDYKDIHSGTFDNSIGAVNRVPRNTVDDQRDHTCSTGLHFASLNYAKNIFGGPHIMVLKIDPADVVSIPRDYNNEKGRCCGYTVVAESSETFTKPVVDDYDDEYEGYSYVPEDYDDDDYDL